MIYSDISRDYKQTELNNSTDDLYVVRRPRIRKRMVQVNGENVSRYRFIRMVKAGRVCQCGHCDDCMALHMMERS
jgi:hypothetical protein